MNSAKKIRSEEIASIPPKLNTLSCELSDRERDAVRGEVDAWTKSDKLRSIWSRDSAVWMCSGEEKWLGWLDIARRQLQMCGEIGKFAEGVRDEGFRDIVLLGMGGSSLCAEVLAKTFNGPGVSPGYPKLRIMDSTDPGQIQDLEETLSLEDTFFIVSSKSGSTLEPNILLDYFFDRVERVVGKAAVGNYFIAITDPGSSLEARAKNSGFREVFHGDPEIGGRYSILSNFGMVPATLMGINVQVLLESTLLMVRACGKDAPPSLNAALYLGAVLGTLGKLGRDKVTIICSTELSGFGDWVEQLLAESTGKEGKGLIPVNEEEIQSSEKYGSDRLFVYMRLESGADFVLDAKMDALGRAGQPVVRISVPNIYQLGQEFFRWEMAVAIAGSVMGINPFDQPDVEASKIETRALTAQFEKSGSLPVEKPIFESEAFEVFGDSARFTALLGTPAANLRASDFIRAHLNLIEPGDYFAMLAYVNMNRSNNEILQGLRNRVLCNKKVATCLEFGPRFLHSTGQVYKGGPNTGVFLQITGKDSTDIPIPGHRYSFGLVKSAEARGDYQVLTERGRRVLRVHLKQFPVSGLDSLRKEMEKAIA